ncbi:VOC family protein [Conexibacter sp. CPCC 206217]|uniref:VOC family protein n=1 Tax=Conexibacter sp. CPCC 206217 TaxID=3064574 RepID=UPI002727416A|nr:VOC family protein [Conexibacter sp. CPCC 206217]MDO8211569.1 VOC family protein [Conexibacter sp. CPCC 206217]
MVTIEQLTIADAPATWAALGFAVEDDACRIGDVRLRFAGRDAGRGLVGWTLRGTASTGLDGLPTARAQRDGSGRADTPGEPVTGTAAGVAAPHPNGVTRIDHVVAVSPQLDRTVAALQAAGLDLRRIREEPTPAGAPRQAFFRLGAELLEVIQEPDEVAVRAGGPDRDAFFWGLALRCDDLDATVAALGERASEVRDAVQPGRRIASVRRVAGLALPVALMTG